MLKRFPSTRLVLLSNEGESVRKRATWRGRRERERTREGEKERERARGGGEKTECIEISLHPVAFEVVR